MEARKIVGYRKFTSKKGSSICIVGINSPFTAREMAAGAVGVKVEEVWIPSDYQGLFTPDVIGKQIQLGYSVGPDGKAYVVDVAIK